MILNETGFTIEYKQRGSPDPSVQAVSEECTYLGCHPYIYGLSDGDDRGS